MALTPDQFAQLFFGDSSAKVTSKLSEKVTINNVARSLDTTFQISDTASALVFYTVELSVQSALLPHSVAVELLVDPISVDPPSTVRCTVSLRLEQLLGLSIAMLQTEKHQLVAWVQPGYTVTLSTSGDSEVTLIDTLELVFDG